MIQHIPIITSYEWLLYVLIKSIDILISMFLVFSVVKISFNLSSPPFSIPSLSFSISISLCSFLYFIAYILFPHTLSGSDRKKVSVFTIRVTSNVKKKKKKKSDITIKWKKFPILIFIPYLLFISYPQQTFEH